jgi:hypothetical protein
VRASPSVERKPKVSRSDQPVGGTFLASGRARAKRKAPEMSRAVSRRLPDHVWVLIGVYCVASLVHFAHNAEYIGFYPNMPAWLTREKVYLAWLGVTSVGIVGVASSFIGWRARLVRCSRLRRLGPLHARAVSQHTLAANLAGGHCAGGALGSVGLVPEIANDARQQPTLSAGQR